MLIASRTLTLRTDQGDKQIPIRIFAPVQHDPKNPRAWSCRFEIDWPDRQKIMEAGGVDSVQALEIALRLIGAIIYASSYHQSSNLFWDAPGKGYGFPVPPNIRDLLIGDDAKYFSQGKILHRTDLPNEIALLYEGQAVSFDIETTRRGLRAVNIAGVAGLGPAIHVLRRAQPNEVVIEVG